GVEQSVVPRKAFARKDGRVAPDRMQQLVTRQRFGAEVLAYRPRVRELERRDARLVFRWQSDPQLEFERRCDFVGEEAADAASRDPAHELATEPAVCERVVAQACARVIAGLLRFELGGHAPVVE